MTNAYFTHMEDYRDIESLNAFRELTENGVVDEEDMMSRLAAVSRDNARTEEALTGEKFQDLLTGEALDLAKPVVLCGHGFLWAKRSI